MGVKPTVLLATGFVDGRGGSKMSAWAYHELKDRGIPVIVATNSMYKYKLDELEIPADIIVQISPEDTKEQLCEKCDAALRDVQYDSMLSIGWRTYWPYSAYKRNIPYVLVDGGIPTQYGSYPSQFIKEVYANTKLFLMTTWFDWKAPVSDLIPAIKVVTQPYSYRRVEAMKTLQQRSKAEVRAELAKEFPILAERPDDLLVYLNMSDAYIDPFNYFPNNQGFVDPFGHKLPDYMSYKEVEPCIGYLHNLIAGFETNYPGNVLLFVMQEKTKMLTQPIVDMCKKVTTFAPKRLDLDLDPYIKKAADVNICRATNCDNQAELSLIGEPCITSVVPRNYMDEDTAAQQAENLGICKQVLYDDPEYMKKLHEFVTDKAMQDHMRASTIKVFDDFWKNNNFWVELAKVIEI